MSQRKTKKSGRIRRPDQRGMRKDNSSKNTRRAVEAEEAIDDVVESKRNDFNWYNAFPQYTAFAGTIPFGTPLGLSYDLAMSGSSETGLDYVIPGIMTLKFSPSIGYSVSRQSAINRSAIRWYTYLRQAQKASADYDSQDMMMAFVALDSCYMFHEWMKRLIGISNLSTPLNRYTPQTLIIANGVDSDDLQVNIAQLWGYINKFAIDLGSVTMPADVDFRVRHQWMCQGLYLDADDVRAQMYMFVPAGFWKYNNTVTTGSQLEFVYNTGLPNWTGAYTQELLKVSDIIAMGNSLINAVFGDEDIGTISGDILNALGSGRVVQLAETPRDYLLVPSYNMEVLSQIENSHAVGEFSNTTAPVITQNPNVNVGAILYSPTLKFAQGLEVNIQHKLLLNFHKATPSVEDVIEATRLTCGYLVDGAIPTTNEWQPQQFGSEILHGYDFWRLPTTGEWNDVEHFYAMNDIYYSPQSAAASTQNLLRILGFWSAFDWAPTFYIHYNNLTSTNPTYNFLSPLVDADTIAALDFEQLTHMHDAALTSLFDLPQMGFTTKGKLE